MSNHTATSHVPEGPAPPSADPAGGPMVELTFDQLFTQRYVPMVRLAYALVGSAEVAEELVQDAFARVYERWRRINQPVAYLRTAVVNACRNEHRRRRTRRRLTPPAPDPAIGSAATTL